MSNQAQRSTEASDSFDELSDGPFDVRINLQIGASNAQHNDAYNQGQDDLPPG